jgi:hypothetical protein
MFSRILLNRTQVAVFAVLISCLPLLSADFMMQVADSDYLSAQGFDVMLYDNTFHPVFVDEKNTAMQMILHGERIATNGDVRLMPTPEQWDLVATLKARHADKEHNRLTADLSFPSHQMTISWKWRAAAIPSVTVEVFCLPLNFEWSALSFNPCVQQFPVRVVSTAASNFPIGLATWFEKTEFLFTSTLTGISLAEAHKRQFRSTCLCRLSHWRPLAR